MSSLIKALFYLSMTLIMLSCAPQSTFQQKVTSNSNAEKNPKVGSIVQTNNAFEYLNNLMDKFHKVFYVYSDADSAGNHFVARGLMPDENALIFVPAMNEHYTKNCHYGDTCIQASFTGNDNRWGGWYFMNGVLSGEETSPKLNWGEYPDAGLNLVGAKQLTFWARGENGGERLQFFAFGLGWNPNSGAKEKPFPDSSNKLTTKNITTTLTTEWQQYKIDLENVDLSYVIGGFGWAAESKQKREQVIFYIDDIEYELSRLEQPRFIESFNTSLKERVGNIGADNIGVDNVMRNVAFTYDNAVALIAYLANGDIQRAKLIADAFVIAQNHDRFFQDNRFRNSYKASEIELFSGWHPNGKNISTGMPGFSCLKNGKYAWCEDEFQISTHTGNVAWVMLALLSYYEIAGGFDYLNAVEKLGEWVNSNTLDNVNKPYGFAGGFEGFEATSNKPQGQKKLCYKATEHNIDLYSAFNRLYLLTKEDKWRQRAKLAKDFVLSMWDENEGKFWTGTGDNQDCTKISKEVIPVDIQAWAVQALLNEDPKYWKGLQYAENHHLVAGGFDFNTNKDGIWYEGTAQMAVAYYITGQLDKYYNTVNVLDTGQQLSGAMPAASIDGLTTGFYVNNGRNEWLYYSREHLGATAWYILAKLKINPFQSLNHG